MSQKIAIVITRMVAGGASQIVRRIINRLGERFRFDLVTGEEDFPEDLEAKLPSVERVLVVPSMIRNIAPVRDLKAFLELRKIFNSRNYELAHTHTSKAGILGRWAAWSADTESIVHTPHGLIYENPGKISGVPDRSIKLTLLKKLEQFSSRTHDAVTTLTNREKSICNEQKLAGSSETVTIHNGVSTKEFEFTEKDRERARDQFGIRDTETLLLSVGRLADEKGYENLINCYESLRDQFDGLRLMIVGTGPREEFIRSEYKSLIESGKLILPGYLDDVHPAYSAADIYVHPSLYEGFGLSVVEAMAAGIPIVASNVGGIPEIARNRKEALLVEPGQTENLKTAIQEVLSDPDLRQRLVEAGQSRAEQFDVSVMVKKYEKLYELLLDNEFNSDKFSRYFASD